MPSKDTNFPTSVRDWAFVHVGTFVVLGFFRAEYPAYLVVLASYIAAVVRIEGLFPKFSGARFRWLTEPNILKSLCLITSRAQREDLELTINGIRDEAQEMHSDGYHWTAICAMAAMQIVTSIAALINDRFVRVIRSIWPKLK